MKKIKLLDGENIKVVNFDNKTNKEFPYYQNKGSRYACCPYCCSVVNVKGGRENAKQSIQQRMYASHQASKVNGFELKDYQECPFYQGNQGNWQGVYRINNKVTENKELRTYIEGNRVAIAEELSELTGVAFKNREGVNSLFECLYQSFIDNGGLHRNQWHPDMISRIMLINSAPVEFWGYKVILDSVVNVIRRNKVLGDNLKLNNQFKSDRDVTFVATMDDNENPQRINVKLVWGTEDEIVLKSVPAKIS